MSPNSVNAYRVPPTNSEPMIRADRFVSGYRGFCGRASRVIWNSCFSGSGIGPMSLVQSYTFLGERDEAVRWIEKVVEQRQSIFIFVNQHLMYASLRDHPRFQEIVRRIGF